MRLLWFAQIDKSKAADLDRLRDRFAHDYSLEHQNGTRYRLTGRADAPLLKQRNRRPEVSLYTLAETAELAIRTVRDLAVSDELQIRIDGGKDTIRRRFTMVLEDDDVAARGD